MKKGVHSTMVHGMKGFVLLMMSSERRETRSGAIIKGLAADGISVYVNNFSLIGSDFIHSKYHSKVVLQL